MNPDETSWKSRAKERVNVALPFGSPQRRAARLALLGYRQSRIAGRELATFWSESAVSFGGEFRYDAWLDQHRSTAEEHESLVASVQRPMSFGVTVVVLAGPGDAEVTLRSLGDQLRPPDVVIRSGRHDVDPSGVLTAGELEDLDAALRAAPGDHFVMWLRAGDRLEPDAVLRILDRVDADPRATMITWDDDVDSGKGPTDPRVHPVTYSPDTLLSAFPYGRSLALRADAVRSVGPIATDLGDDSIWDLVLRLAPVPDSVVHLPRVLGHLVRRPAAVGRHGCQVVQSHLDRSGLQGDAVRSGNAVRVRWSPSERPRVTVAVPTRHNTALIGPLIDSLRSTEYPDWELVVVDNGGRSDSHEAFYAQRAEGMDHSVIWWDEPFNYGAVNNAAIAAGSGEVVVLLNDDTVVHSPGWLDELVGWLAVPGVGTVGVQMIDPEGTIQHGGAIVGAAGLADHRFQGLAPHSETILGSTDWYWDSTANTGACVALRRSLWDDIGGLDERFVLCGSDVVLGLDVRRRGLRNVCTPAIHVDHLESATRRTEVPVGDIFASYWRYARLLRFGDPYHNPNVSLMSRDPALRAPDEPSALERVGPSVGRAFGGAFVQSASEHESRLFGATCRADSSTVAAIQALHDAEGGPIDVETVNWFVPDFDNPFYGGLATIFRIANHLRVHHDVQNRFVVWGQPNEMWFRSGLAAVFPGLESSDIVYCGDLTAGAVADIPPADVSIATQWQTAYQVAHFPHTRRKFYLIQDFEPMFNPAGTLYALAEETYKLGLIGLCNTEHLLDLYEDRYQGRGRAFVPAVDRGVFHADGRATPSEGDPINVFVYARPGHWRNCWELAEPALRAVKRRFGRRVRIVTAGAWTSPSDLADGFDHLGLLDYVDTGSLYRTCDVGVSLTVSEHPSYLPLELMACGVPVVAFDLPPGYWILHDGENALLAQRTVDGLEEQITALVEDAALRARLRAGALTSIADAHSSWDDNLAHVYSALSGPLERSSGSDAVPTSGRSTSSVERS